MNMKKTRILHADGNTNMRQPLAEFLRNDGYVVEEAVDGLDALRMMESNQYDLIIAEIKMPKMDGVELLERIKEIKSDLPVILVSGYATHKMVEDLKSIGCFKHIWKPYDMKLVLEVVRGAIKPIEI